MMSCDLASLAELLIPLSVRRWRDPTRDSNIAPHLVKPASLQPGMAGKLIFEGPPHHCLSKSFGQAAKGIMSLALHLIDYCQGSPRLNEAIGSAGSIPGTNEEMRG
jgi:hypothetical protein